MFLFDQENIETIVFFRRTASGRSKDHVGHISPSNDKAARSVSRLHRYSRIKPVSAICIIPPIMLRPLFVFDTLELDLKLGLAGDRIEPHNSS